MNKETKQFIWALVLVALVVGMCELAEHFPYAAVSLSFVFGAVAMLITLIMNEE